MKPFSSPGALRRGFTLLEVMVATSIMVIIVLAVVTIASDTFKAYDRAVADLSTQSEGRGVLDALENDLQTAVIRPDGRCWMEVVLPGSSGAPSKAPPPIGNMQGLDQPILMFFASPPDRPRWNPALDGAGKRQLLKGDVCAISYRLGQRSPFDMPGEPIQQVYGVYRTIIDPEGTFTEALPIIFKTPPTGEPDPEVRGTPLAWGPNAAPTPWDYWSGPARTVSNYGASDNGGLKQSKVLINNLVTGDGSGKSSCWTLDDQNFIGSNVVAMNLTFWCTSSLPFTAVAPALKDPVARLPQALRPVLPVALDTFKFGSTVHGGYAGAFRAATTGGTTAAAPLRYAPATPTVPAPMPSAAQVHPYDYFGSRLRIYADRMYPDSLLSSATSGVATTAPLPYLPYSLKAVEVSLTVLTPDGSKELRALQQIHNPPPVAPGTIIKIPDADYRRIVNQYGRNYSRYIRLLANGG
jgi:prepilin-type N-terminal cleavage/methylation domain-containing protein